jgi:putative SOS response-associated peptidase YedK
MCAHYESPEDREIRDLYELTRPDNPLAGAGTDDAPSPPKLDSFPATPGRFLRLDGEGKMELVYGRFGLIPHWTKKEDLPKAGRGAYNARTETVHEKPTFRTAWQRRYWCLIPVKATFEPCYETGKCVMRRVSRVDGKPMMVAGLYWPYKAPGTDEVMDSYTMLTINADDHPVMNRFHKEGDEKRMVVVIPEGQEEAWLHATHDEARTFFCQYPATLMQIDGDQPKVAVPALG